MYSKGGQVEWHIVFTESKLSHWIYRIVDRDIGHVYAVQSLNDYQWLVVQPHLNITSMKIYTKLEYPHIRLIVGPDAKMVTVKAKPQAGVRGGLCWYNCVEQVKALIGVKSFWTITPKQLYNGLIGGRYGVQS